MSTREGRLAEIFHVIRAQERATIQELVDRFGVSAVTIRKDLEELEQRGGVIRTLGGAIVVRGSDPEIAFPVRARLRDREKQLIGMEAAAMIRSGESVIIDAGSTALEIVHHLRGLAGVTIITPALNVALEAGALPDVTVIMPGPGVFDQISQALEGPEVEEAMRQFHADKYFLGLRSIDLEHGCMDTDMRRVRLKRSMMRAARETIALADSSKIGRTSLIQIAPLEAMSAIITDDGIGPDVIDQLEKTGVRVCVARAREQSETGGANGTAPY